MHDPMTVAWELRLLLPWREPKHYRNREGALMPRRFIGGVRRFVRLPLLTIWHVDPERDGSDDSCSVSKRLSSLQRQMLVHAGGDEARRPWFLRERAREPSSPADAECLLRGALWHVASITRLNRWSLFHRRITFAQCTQLANELIHNSVDNVRSSLCLLPGWHTNDRMVVPHPQKANQDDFDMNSPEYDQYLDELAAQPLDHYPKDASPDSRRRESEDFFYMCGRILARRAARWWQHPRWHFWHWHFQVHPWQRFLRRFVERCSICHARYRGRNDVYSGFGGGQTWCGDCQAKTDKVAAR